MTCPAGEGGGRTDPNNNGVTSPLLPGGVAVVLAAGSGRRFGGAKQLALLAGRPLLLWALRAALDSGLERGLVVLGGHADQVRARLPNEPRLAVLDNPDYLRGMGTSLALAARWCRQRRARVMAVLLGDQPLVAAEMVWRVAQAALDSPAGAAAALVAKRPVHPVAFAARHFEELSRLSGDHGGRGLLRRLGDSLSLLPAPEYSAWDVDRPADLAEAQRLLAGGLPRD